MAAARPRTGNNWAALCHWATLILCSSGCCVSIERVNAVLGTAARADIAADRELPMGLVLDRRPMIRNPCCSNGASSRQRMADSHIDAAHWAKLAVLETPLPAAAVWARKIALTFIPNARNAAWGDQKIQCEDRRKIGKKKDDEEERSLVVLR